MEGISLFDNSYTPNYYLIENRKYIISYDFSKYIDEYFAGVFSEDSTYTVNYTNGKKELYDSKNDPHNENNLMDKFPEKAVTFQSFMDEWMQAHNFDMDSIYNNIVLKEVVLDQIDKTKFKALGYIK
jgi:hypothetical protein